ncbi:TonB-dependent receptor [Aurantibacter crassamenti]|uniref:SusC/RagA family TonB-linked outer membrane protein n=1 Tax=Aurantibacter crassamenti TaxID=1837375 RepID=UPI001939E121|nr:TonB-dependent receptor [Aurantibacter crassamenti]MBM1106185.1 TonB-dependent receptor [Aurantibacter crassamenti]
MKLKPIHCLFGKNLQLLLFALAVSQICSANVPLKAKVNSIKISVESIQDLTITGTILDQDGVPLPGASVVEKGTTNGTQTDFDGNFSLLVGDDNAILLISYIGYSSQEVSVNGQTNINVNLEQSASNLDEVVVVGYGTQIKRQVTGSVQTIEAADLADLPVSQVTQKLQGKLAGVQINQTTGKPGQGMSVRIRGQLSVSGGSDPLYVIDGFPISGGINSLNPDEIEDITILKDAASTSLYGSRAANGVVLITTKNGTPGETHVSFNTSTGIQQVPQRGRIDMMDAVEFAQFKKEYYEDQGDPVPEIFQDPSQYIGKNNDWYGALLRTAPVQNYNLTITSNKENLRTAVVAGFFKQEGVVLNSDYERYSLRANLDYDISDRVRVGFNIAPSFIKDNTPRSDGDRGTGILFNALHTWPVMPIYNPDGTRTTFNRFPADTGNIFSYANWLTSAEQIKNETKDVNILSNAFLEYEPIDGLTIKTSLNAEIYNREYEFFSPSTATYRINRPIPTDAEAIWEDRNDFSYLNENLATYTKSFGDHNVSLLGGFTYQKFRRDISRVQANTFSDDRLPTIQGAANIDRGNTYDRVQEWSLVSFLSRFTYNYQGKYLLTAAIRRDGSSRFGADNRWGNFPSVSAGWIASDETFMENYDAISMLKLRASFGVTGNNNIGNYTQYALIDNTVNAVFDDALAPGSAVNSLSNSNLGWETTKQFDIGLDLSLFNDRVSFVYDYYTKNTTNLLYNVQVPRESGFSEFSDNIGEIKFWGHEFALNTVNTTGKFKWTTSANISFNRNEVVSLAEGIDRVYGLFHITKVGEPFGQFYGHIADGVYLNQQDLDSSPQVPGRSTVGSIKLLDLNGDGTITRGGDEDDRAIMGNPFPDFTYGITNTIKYGNFDFSIIGTGSQGNQVLIRHLYSTANLDGVFNLVDGVKYRFRSEENPGLGFYGTTVGGGNVTGIERDWMNSRFVADASYFNIRNITLGYTLPGVKKFFESARIYGSIQNVHIFTKYWGGPNPEISGERDGDGDGGNLSQGVDFSGYPVPRIFSLGLNLNF